tara:strand:- start:42 stop:326 length:285 start_codon:yes stop_codon:yes gene_type:complete
MDEPEHTDNKEKLPPEDMEQVAKIAKEIIDPALQKALGEARQHGTDQEVISALANCYAGLLIDLMGHDVAAKFLQGHAFHIASREEKPLTIDKH